MPNFTPTQQKIIDMLSDGKPHSRKELKRCLPDELAELKTVNVHIAHIRLKLRPLGEDIICEMGPMNHLGFRHIRLLTSSTSGTS